MGRFHLAEEEEEDDEHDDDAMEIDPSPMTALIRISTTTEEEEDESEDGEQSIQTHASHHNNDKTPIHYHVYYPEPPESPSSSLFFRNCGWLCITLMAVLSHILYWYGPSVPPEEHTDTGTWYGLVQEQSQLLAAILSTWFQIGHYVTFWTWQSVQQDWNSNSNIRTESMDGCRLAASSWDMAPKTYLFGPQEVAFQRALSVYSNWGRQSPLVFYITGGPGVGKRHLAKSMAQQLLVNCDGDDQDILLHVSSTKSDDESEQALWNRLLDHVTDHPLGSMIVLTHVDKGTQISLSSILGHLNAHATVFGNTIVLVTSKVGKATIDKTLRHYGQAQLPLLELDSYLRYEIAGYHHGPDQNEQQDATSSSSSTTDLFSEMTILPLLPLDREAIAEILQYQFQEQLGVAISTTDADDRHHDDSLGYLLDHAVEWQTWVHKQTGQELFSFASTGALAVTRIMERIPLKECGSGPISDSDSLPVLQLQSSTGGHFQVLACPKDQDLETSHDDCQRVCQFYL